MTAAFGKGDTMAVHESGEGGQGKGPPVPGQRNDATDREEREIRRDDADCRKALTDAIALALEERARLERVIASGIRQQVELYDRSFAQTSEVVPARLVEDRAPSEPQARDSAEQRKAGVEVLPSGLTGKLVAADVHDYRKLKDPHQRAEAALAMAETARVNAGYRKALDGKAPDVSDAVRAAMTLAGKSRDSGAAAASADGPSMPQNPAAGDASHDPAMTRSPGAPERTATHRAQDLDASAGQLTLNGIGQVARRKQTGREPQPGEKTSAPTSAEAGQPKAAPARAPGGNQVASDEVFTATRDGSRPVVPAGVEDRYLRVGSRFYHPRNPDTVAFEDKGNRLETRSSSGQIAETMVTIARARGWDEIRVTGSETFRREVWLEAAAHGMQVKGYTPSEVDRVALAKRSRRIEANEAKPEEAMRGAGSRSGAVPESVHAGSVMASERRDADRAGKAAPADQPRDRQPEAEVRERARAFARKPAADALRDYPELAGTYAVIASMKKRAAADGLSPQQRAVVMARIEANLVTMIERGELPQIQVRERVEIRREHTVNREIRR